MRENETGVTGGSGRGTCGSADGLPDKDPVSLVAGSAWPTTEAGLAELRRVISRCLRVPFAPGDLDDLVSEAIARAWRASAAQAPRSVLALCLRIARDLAVDAWRARRATTLALGCPRMDGLLDPADQRDEPCLREELLALLPSLESRLTNRQLQLANLLVHGGGAGTLGAIRKQLGNLSMRDLLGICRSLRRKIQATHPPTRRL